MSSEQVLEAVMDLKEDIGGVKADIKALTAALALHVASSATAHARITTLELHNARIRGAITVWSSVAVALGTGVGFLIEFLLTWFKDRPHG